MSPTDKNKDTNSRHRSFKGCWTCKKKRIQCDEIRPACTKCTSRGIICEGYEIRLRWGAGIASRGKYSGAEKPVKESIPPRSKRRWDMRGKGEHFPQGDGQGQPILVPQHTLKGQDPPHLVAQRATVNILNSPWEPDSPEHITAIHKHFEIPVSLATLAEATAHMHSPGKVQQANISGRQADGVSWLEPTLNLDSSIF
ncbi:uncharacterized protein N7529_000386 [Penicillium soppii]|uniref:uncharacterized protein n=1 Tax=Penicillium soppii TaxID=69789 RepID=UPI002546EE03|nr:uncharacterized protein N7529_000386 [Penicillium soppii]KAJ5881714.1 hypothetical protein N7529_000386 [Penicillium soppii]